MGYKGITQITLIIIALVVGFTFTQPILVEIRGLQDDILQYKDAIAKASELNSRLQELMATRDSFDQTQLAALEKMLPTSIDQLATMHEIENIFGMRDVPITSLTASEAVEPVGEDVLLEASTLENVAETQGLSYQDYTIEFSGTYWQMRDLLVLFEASATLFEVVELSFGTDELLEIDNIDGVPEQQRAEEGEKSFQLIVRTFALPATSIIN